MRPNGAVVEVLGDGSERPIAETPMLPMTLEEVEEAARADPDARPMTSESWRRHAASRASRHSAARSASLRKNSPRATGSRRAPCATGSMAARNPTSPPALISPSSPTTRRVCGGRWKGGRDPRRCSVGVTFARPDLVPGCVNWRMSYPSRFGILARKGRQIFVVPAKAAVMQFRGLAREPFPRRSRESGNPGISVTCPWVPACAGTTVGGHRRFDYRLESGDPGRSIAA